MTFFSILRPAPLLLLTGSLFTSPVQAQIVGKSVPEFKTTAGTVVHIGDTLRLGRGTLATGEFQYVYVPANVFTGSQQINFSSQMSNLTVRVKDLRFQQSKNYGNKPVAVVKANTLNGCVDLDAAESAGEIITANTRRAAVSAAAGPASASPPLSTADELLKLKKLYDQKVLTKAEYDAQKSKLLK
ncbi:SHOCT domain-containing protein [Hymenobacter sp. IS2118]|uniref:SHOCT domain-containing protein n=1 Tax=Hymenobacter sp. IS2118 TaxID=1505605 RepID=UPI001268347D|nr:SHOCT domain-containing protein [Hymenobacter sp. IS2118]